MRDASALALAVEHMETESGQKSPQTNDLLATLSPTDLDRLVQQAEYVELPNGQTLITPHTSFDHVYFPLTCMVSLVQPLADGAMIEVGVVGREGMVGIAALLGTTTVPSHAMAQIPGDALRIKVTTLREEIERNAKFRDLMYRYVLAMFVQIAQSAACNGRHSLEQRLGRWLLMAHDRVEGDELRLSHEFISMMLGTRRAGVTVSVATFRTAGLISNTHGRITILDRKGLEAISCECYAAVRDETRRLQSR